MPSKSTILDAQRAWATAAGTSLDTRGYHASVAQNLFQPLSSSATAAFSNGSGSEMRDSALRPAKMRAVHSSAALAVNFFDYWTDKDASPLLSALGFDRGAAFIAFEAQFPTGLEGIPPNLDVALRFDDGPMVGIESKFTEWMTPKPPGKVLFKPKYFPVEHGLWAANGLPACQVLAEQVHAGNEVFRYLDVAQLLKHALGLSKQHPGQFELQYLFFDCPGKESVTHRNEVERFAALVGAECKFRWASYQDVYGAMGKATGPEHEAYMGYLRDRYFPDTSRSPTGT